MLRGGKSANAAIGAPHTRSPMQPRRSRGPTARRRGDRADPRMSIDCRSSTGWYPTNSSISMPAPISTRPNLGDGVLLDMQSPGAAIAAADGIIARLHREPGMPEITGGITTGTVVERGDDILGAAVNLAARLADLAAPGELRVTEPAARAAAEAGWRVEAG